MSNHYVYELLHPTTLEPFYVGKGKGDRFLHHVTAYNRPSEIKSNPLKCAAIRALVEQGLQPLYRVTVCSSNEDACLLEQQMIAEYGRKVLKTGPLTNIANGGEGGASKFVPIHKYSLGGDFIETFVSISEAIAKEKPTNESSSASAIANCAKGKTMSALGFIWSYDKLEKVPARDATGKFKTIHQYTADGKYVATFDSPTVAAEQISGNKSSIQNAANPNCKQKSAHGFLWSYEKYDTLPAWTHELIRPVKQLDAFDNVIATYKSIAEASRATGIDQGNISACCSGSLQTAGSFIWRSVEDVR